MERDLLTILPTMFKLVPTVVVIAPIVYMVLSNWQKPSGESR